MWKATVTLVDEMRVVLHRLVEITDQLNAERDISAPTRAVLEFLDRNGPTTVPDIARARHVSRQHIQTLVNELTTAGLVESLANPGHRRSSLSALTQAGVEVITSTLAAERQAIEPLLATVPADGIAAAAETMHTIRLALEAGQETTQ